MRFIINILFVLIIFTSFGMILWNQMIISNNNECISIKFDEGEGERFCSCVDKSKKMNIGWITPELEEDYEETLNKFCRNYASTSKGVRK